jgi:tetratricopeptide (TPR) repeat protein
MGVIDNLESLLAKGQDSALLRYGLGCEYLRLQRLDQAIVHLRKAIELDADYSAAWKQLGKALAAADRRGEAIAAYEAGVRVAERKGDVQAAKEMRVFLKRLRR